MAELTPAFIFEAVIPSATPPAVPPVVPPAVPPAIPPAEATVALPFTFKGGWLEIPRYYETLKHYYSTGSAGL